MEYLPIQEISARIANSNYSERNPFYTNATGVSFTKKKEPVDDAPELKAANQQLMRQLTPEERRIVDRLQKTDQEIRAHEQAHLTASGGLAKGVPQLQFVTGPDGQRYAIAGEVQIQFQIGANPEKNIEVARQVQRAALAPANPSSADLAVARQAAQLEAEAVGEKLRENRTDTASRSVPVGILGPQSREAAPELPGNQAEKIATTQPESTVQKEKYPVIEREDQEHLARNQEKVEEKRQAFLQDPIISWLLGLEKDKDNTFMKKSDLPQLGDLLEKEKKGRFSANA